MIRRIGSALALLWGVANIDAETLVEKAYEAGQLDLHGANISTGGYARSDRSSDCISGDSAARFCGTPHVVQAMAAVPHLTLNTPAPGKIVQRRPCTLMPFRPAAGSAFTTISRGLRA